MNLKCSLQRAMPCAKYWLYLVVIVIGFSSCKKYLDKKSDQRLSTPDTIEDLQAILDNSGLSRAMIELNIGSDEYFILEADLLAYGSREQKGYIWDIQENTADVSQFGWNYQYNNLFLVNTVLDNMERVPSSGQEIEWNSIKGSALFYRAYYFYQLAQVYAKQYDAATAATDLGIPLRLNSDFNQPSVRATVQETYDQMIEDANTALSLLPNSTKYPTRPNRPAAFALLSRIHLIMGDFEEAKKRADSCLNLYNTLIDYKSIPELPTNYAPFDRFNPEVIFHIEDSYNSLNSYPGSKIDSNLYRSFQDNDLRKAGYFIDNGDGTYIFKGNYTGSPYYQFNGIATDEIYLIRAECNARLGNTDAALQDLNTLLENRFDATFVPVMASSADEAQTLILQERKKELIYRGLRWIDLRRLNKEPTFQTTLTRVVGADTYVLLPNDPRYVYPIPQEIIRISGIQQNVR